VSTESLELDAALFDETSGKTSGSAESFGHFLDGQIPLGSR
jgi:hypothetical protein